MNCENEPKPIGYVPTAIGKERLSYFLTNKFGPLTDYLGKPER